MTRGGVTSPTFKTDVWSFGLLCLEVFTDADPYCTSQDFYVPVLLSQGIPPEHPGTAAVGLSSKMWELMQSCWEVDPAARPDMLKIQLAMRDMLPRIDPRPIVIARRTSTSPAETQPLLPTRVSPTTDGGSSHASHETNRSSSESSFLPAPLTPSPPSGGLQLTLEPSPTIPSLRLSRLPELEGTLNGTPRKASIAPSLGSLRLPSLREDDYEPHSAGISVPLSAPPMAPPMAPPQLSRSSSRPSTAPSSSPRPTLASDFQGHSRSTSSPSQSPTSPTSPDPSEVARPKRKFSLWPPKRSQSSASGKCDPVTVLPKPTKPPKPTKSKSSPPVRSQTNPAEMRRVPSRSSTILPTITTTRQRVPASEDVLRFLKSAASDRESLLRLARDGTVSAGNLEGLLSRAILGSSDSARDERFKAAFLTIYQLFATSEQVFESITRRFEATSADPSVAGSRYL
jgi:hypothetical protein